MSVVPEQKVERIGFYRQHAGKWQAVAPQTGLSGLSWISQPGT